MKTAALINWVLRNDKKAFRIALLLLFWLQACGPDKPGDPTRPSSPEDELNSFSLRDGFRMELVASEPLISEPTGICWDEKGRLYVGELHGYNLAGELEIQEMNKRGIVDTVVQRVPAAEEYRRKAAAGTYGTIKRLTDTDGDGRMDKSEILADHIAPVYGLCASMKGLIVAGQTEIMFVRDADDDGKADIIDTLYTGFKGGELERGINAPQWRDDGWIYFGIGWGGGTINGPHLSKPTRLPHANFRARADGSAIEPVTGTTHTIGHATTADGDVFFTNTWKHALYAIPIPWQYIARNPDAIISPLEADASNYSRVYPISPVHPWKLARSNEPEWKKLYSKYGPAESSQEGYFTSACSPMIYQDALFPAEYNGNLFVCEPAQCFVHRSIVEHDGTGLKVKRAAGEDNREFLASKDSWFRPVSLTTAPDGSIYITDMYREIIEDYSAVPRYLQQKYGLKNGMNMGRIWRLSPVKSPSLKETVAADLSTADLHRELNSQHYWRSQTARRLLYERSGTLAAARNVPVAALLGTSEPRGFIQALRSGDTILRTDHQLARKLAKMRNHIAEPRMLLQLALSLGYSNDPEVFSALTQMARQHLHIRWMTEAILTGVHERAGIMLDSLLRDPGNTGDKLLQPLAATISARRNINELSKALNDISRAKSSRLQALALKGINENINQVSLRPDVRRALMEMMQSKDAAVKGEALQVALRLKIADGSVLSAIYEKAADDVANASLPAQERFSAIELLSGAPDEMACKALLHAWQSATPMLRSAIIDALLVNNNRLPALLTAIKTNIIPAAAFSALQKTQFLEKANQHIRFDLEALFASAESQDEEKMFVEYVEALSKNYDTSAGRIVFAQMCSSCHRVGDIGTAVGPDLKNSFSNSSQTILRNMLFPSESIASGFDTYLVKTQNDEQYNGVLVSESVNNIVIRLPGGTDKTFLRKDIKDIKVSQVSLMPSFMSILKPADCANIIAWMKSSLAKD